jgi:nicotinamidase-related amidase
MAIWDDVIGAEEQAQYERAGWGGTVGFGERPALVVVDMYNAFVDPAYPFSSEPAPQTATTIRTLLDAFRERGLPIFHTRAKPEALPAARGRWKVRATTKDPRMQSPEAYEFWHEVAPLPGEQVLEKTYPSAFFGTTLTSQLVYHGIDTLVVTGTVTSGCVRGTCLDAFNLNYRVIVPEDGVCDRGIVSHKVALFEIQMKYGDVVPSESVLRELARLPS